MDRTCVYVADTQDIVLGLQSTETGAGDVRAIGKIIRKLGVIWRAMFSNVS